ncbi:MAG: FAD:protein FMN transferase [Candidatus Moraniibacteriota bacterium]
MKAVEREVRGEIMRTDIFVKLVSETRSEADLNRDLSDAFSMFRDIGSRFSRFQNDSELSRLNVSSEIAVSPEMAALLSEALVLYRETDGVFDPSILPNLEKEGYAGSFGSESFGVPASGNASDSFAFDSLSVDLLTGIIRKPAGLRIDLGGIAKGYAVDRVVRMLRERGNEDFLVDAGGDIYTSGCDTERGYGYWAIDVAVPSEVAGPPPLLMLRNVAVATSGTDRRRWTTVDGSLKHHLIDPRTGKSAVTDILSATVVGDTVLQAEVFAKTLCILGRDQAFPFAEKRHIPTFLVTTDGKTVYTDHMRPFMFNANETE